MVVDGDVERALRKLRRALRFGGLPAHLIKPDHYEKPSQRRLRKKRWAELRHRQQLVRQWTEDRWGVCGGPAYSRHFEWVYWARSSCRCETCRWLRGDLNQPPVD